MGPIQAIVINFQDANLTGGIAEQLRELSDRGIIRVLEARVLVKDANGDLLRLRASELSESEREDLRAMAGMFLGLGMGLAIAGEEGAIAGAELGATAGAASGTLGLDAEDVVAIGADMAPGDAVLLLLIENVWATGLRDAIVDAGAVSVTTGYVTPDGLIALGEALGLVATS